MTARMMSRFTRLAFGLLGGGMLLQTSCSDEVQAAVLIGAETTAVSIANALIAAWFEGLL